MGTEKDRPPVATAEALEDARELGTCLTDRENVDWHRLVYPNVYTYGDTKRRRPVRPAALRTLTLSGGGGPAGHGEAGEQVGDLARDAVQRCLVALGLRRHRRVDPGRDGRH